LTTLPVPEVIEALQQFRPDCRIIPPRSGVVSVYYAPAVHAETLKHALAEAYRRRYPDIRIQYIELQTNTIDAPDDFSACTPRISPQIVRRNRGTLVAVCGRKHYFFRYRVDATVRVHKANHQIKRDTILTSNDVTAVWVPLEVFPDRPIDPGEGRFIARQNIRQGAILTERKVAPVPDVRKRARVHCYYIDGAVRIDFDAMALKNGYLGDSVPVRKDNGLLMHGIVRGRNEVEIQ